MIRENAWMKLGSSTSRTTSWQGANLYPLWLILRQALGGLLRLWPPYASGGILGASERLFQFLLKARNTFSRSPECLLRWRQCMGVPKMYVFLMPEAPTMPLPTSTKQSFCWLTVLYCYLPNNNFLKNRFFSSGNSFIAQRQENLLLKTLIYGNHCKKHHCWHELMSDTVKIKLNTSVNKK